MKSCAPGRDGSVLRVFKRRMSRYRKQPLMPARPIAARSICSWLIRSLSTVLALSAVALSASAQQLPDAPAAHADSAPALASDPATETTSSTLLSLPEAPEQQPPVTRQSLTLRQRFVLQTRTSFAPLAFILPASEAGITMAHPPSSYPRDWTDGGGAFAHNYGAELGRHTTAGYAHFVAAAILHEDPRYTPSTHKNYFARSMHAFLFTVIDESNSGHRDFAASNFAGAVAAGFVGMAWEPNGFDDVTHAYQRSAVELTAFAGRNLVAEFSPEFNRILTKLHLEHTTGAIMPPPATTTPQPTEPTPPSK